MYNWDKNNINNLIKQLQNIDPKNIDIINEIDILKELKSTIISKLYEIKFKTNYNIKKVEEEYEELKQYDYLINLIYKKYNTKKEYNIIYSEIESSKEDILLFTRDNLYNLDNNIGQLLERYIYNKKYISYKKNNDNYILHLPNLNKYFISLNKENNICDFFYPTHEFLHIYTSLLNPNFLNYIETEFFSILGELITAHELKSKNMFYTDVINYEMENYNDIIIFSKDLKKKLEIIQNQIQYKNAYKYLKKYYKTDKEDLKNIYSTSLEYDYSTLISYMIALELFEIYKQDKEKCLYISKNIITDDNKLSKKLKNNNIELCTHDDIYFKELKKEYIYK